MATINKNIIKPKPIKYSKPIDKNIDNSSNYYNSEAWKRLRHTYISLHPVCEECLRHEHVEPAEHVHHIYPFMKEHTIEARWNTFLNENNLRALCKCCHYGYHYKMRHYKTSNVTELTEDEWKQAKLLYDDDGCHVC